MPPDRIARRTSPRRIEEAISEFIWRHSARYVRPAKTGPGESISPFEISVPVEYPVSTMCQIFVTRLRRGQLNGTNLGLKIRMLRSRCRIFMEQRGCAPLWFGVTEARAEVSCGASCLHPCLPVLRSRYN